MDYVNGFIGFIKGYVIFNILHVITYYLVKKFKKFGDYSENSDETEQNKKKVLEKINYQKKIISQIKPYADINQNIEKSVGLNGLIIHYAYYGNSQNLKEIYNNLDTMSKKELDIYCNNYENEIFEVTIPVQYLLKRDQGKTFSSIFFYQIPKTQILGFTNPIFKKTSKKPSLLIK